MDTNEHECSYWESTEDTEQTEMPRRLADNILKNQKRNKTLIDNDANGSGGSAVRHASRKCKQRHAVALSPWCVSSG